MIKRAGETFGVNGGHDSRYSTLTGDTFGADHQFQHIDATNIGGETGCRCCRALQYGITGSGFIGEGPVIAQRTP